LKEKFFSFLTLVPVFPKVLLINPNTIGEVEHKQILQELFLFNNNLKEKEKCKK